ncbi:MAG: UDP-N-acetylmuramate dehydrogenase [Gammaproteobacteria bacterium]|nr:MAG: UDP-N-acetylmuramate dehydrogenase [Gammaproteobacteria bacterium]
MSVSLHNQELRGELLRAEPMSKHTSWRVGGVADQYYKPADLEDLSYFLRLLPNNEPLFWIGLGSNLLVRDGGIRGTVIVSSGLLNKLLLVNDETVRAEAGVASAKLARFSVQQGLTGAEFFAGIPGTVGGALAMNAGAFGSETWSVVKSAETMDRQGKIKKHAPEDFDIAYRHVAGPEDEWFVAAYFKLARASGDTGRERIRSLLAKRGATQPTQLPNAGSVFKNPEGDYAARLIEASGLKGKCIGGACVSEMHANFIVNNNLATANDIEELIYYVQQEVECSQGIRLEPEVRIIGEAA